MTPTRAARFRVVLEAERDRLEKLVAAAVAVPVTAASPIPGDEFEPGMVGPAEIDDTAMVARASGLLAQVNQALHLIETEPEEYGVCSVCGFDISDARLELVPTTRRCSRHADVTP